MRDHHRVFDCQSLSGCFGNRCGVLRAFIEKEPCSSQSARAVNSIAINPKYISKKAERSIYLFICLFLQKDLAFLVCFETERRVNGTYTKTGIAANRTSLYAAQQGNYFLKVEIYCSKVESRVF